MCGIAGKINFNGAPADDAELDAMRGRMRHRGPDGSGVKTFANCGLAHARLSIIDLPGGAQPLSNEDGSVWTVFNGEIYNFREIRRELLDKGHVFGTNSDTEVIVHLYEEEGRGCVRRMNGMFSLAILDMKRNKLLLARDRLGQKPLHYFRNGGAFAFASELSALKILREFPAELDHQALHHYFSLQYVPCPSTAYRNVFKLPPAHTLELDTRSGEFDLQRYWRLDFGTKREIGEDEASVELYDLLLDSVRLRLMSDVPLGTFLSGGMDSSIITALMSELGVSPLRTFTVGFTQKLYDERYAARRVSARFATCHYEKMGDPDDFDLLKSLIAKTGEPYADSSILPTALISAFAAREVKVVLGGDGADELFCGYYRYLLMKYAAFAGAIPQAARTSLSLMASSILPSSGSERTLSGKMRRILGIFAEKPENRYARIIIRFDEEMKKSIYGERMRESLGGTPDFLASFLELSSSNNGVEKHSELDIATYLNGDILAKLDTASMASSLEARSPFLDYRVAEFAASLPLKLKQKGGQRKYILRKCFRGIVPDEILDREKKGFGVPVADWFRASWRKIAEEHILEGRAVKDGFLSAKAASGMLSGHADGNADHSYAIFAMLCFALWLEGE